MAARKRGISSFLLSWRPVADITCRLGLYGFGAAASVAIQVARHWGADVDACTHDQRH